MDKKSPLPQYEYVPNTRDQPPPFDFERLTRFMAYGFIMSPLQFQWFSFLSKAFPVTKGSGTLPAFKRMACDQLIFAPIGLAAFFTFMTIAEGGGRRAISRKFQDIYLPSLKANWMIWPVVQILNFRVVPVPFQIVSLTVNNVCSMINTMQPFVSSVGIVWTCYLSLTNSSEEEKL